MLFHFTPMREEKKEPAPQLRDAAHVPRLGGPRPTASSSRRLFPEALSFGEITLACRGCPTWCRILPFIIVVISPPVLSFRRLFFLFCFPLCGAAAIVTPRFEFRFSAVCVPAIATAAAGSPLAVVAALLSRAAFRRNMRRSLAVWFDICSDGFRLHSFACVAYSYFW